MEDVCTSKQSAYLYLLILMIMPPVKNKKLKSVLLTDLPEDAYEKIGQVQANEWSKKRTKPNQTAAVVKMIRAFKIETE